MTDLLEILGALVVALGLWVGFDWATYGRVRSWAYVFDETDESPDE